MNDFPYVDGDLFKDQHESLHFSAKSRKLIIEAGELLKWDQINPDILGSMIQAVASEDSRSHLGMHYTSVPNIMKVIKPLFLDGLREDFEAAKGNENKLQQLYDRIGKIKFMDPACGSGNFLIITYKELRQLEIDILIELNNIGISTMYVPSVTLDQFYGIEIEDFACDVTRLSLWIAEHQMNVRLHKLVSDAIRPTLPLQHAGAIVTGNALRLKWDEILDVHLNEVVFVFGNPPYLGSKRQSKDQKDDLEVATNNLEGYKSLDYISGWFMKAKCLIDTQNASVGFVSTNSICEGEQVSLLWPYLLTNNTHISYAYRSFMWNNNAKSNAAVKVVIIGLSARDQRNRTLVDGDQIFHVDNITPYLTEGRNTIVGRESSGTINQLPRMQLGDMQNDNGGLKFTRDEYYAALNEYPELGKVFKKVIGARELLNGGMNYCLWFASEGEYLKFSKNPIVAERVNIVYEHRANSKDSGTRKLANIPWRYREQFIGKERTLILPRHSSENRYYMPISFVGNDTVVPDSANAVYDAPIYLLALLESNMHMVWLRSIGGKLKTDYRYSASLVYNTFPVPDISARRISELEGLSFDLLDKREEIGGTLAKMYGSPLAIKKPQPMNEELMRIHARIDEVVDKAYKKSEFKSDAERLALLLAMYEERTSKFEK